MYRDMGDAELLPLSRPRPSPPPRPGCLRAPQIEPHLALRRPSRGPFYPARKGSKAVLEAVRAS